MFFSTNSRSEYLSRCPKSFTYFRFDHPWFHPWIGRRNSWAFSQSWRDSSLLRNSPLIAKSSKYHLSFLLERHSLNLTSWRTTWILSSGHNLCLRSCGQCEFMLRWNHYFWPFLCIYCIRDSSVNWAKYWGWDEPFRLALYWGESH